MNPQAPHPVLEFTVKADTKTYAGTLNVTDWDESCTLPKMVNSLMVNLAESCPEIHNATQMEFVCKLVIATPVPK